MAVSCTETAGTDGKGRPLTISPASELATKGYVTGTTLFDTEKDSLHGQSVTAARTIMLSTYLVGQNGLTEGTYFCNEPFNITPRGVWAHDPDYLWPIGAQLAFIGYSTEVPLAIGEIEYDPVNCTEKMRISLDRSHTQDDFLFGYRTLTQPTDSSDGTSMTFSHAQAWIQFVISCAEGSEGTVQFDRLVLLDAYTDGLLTVTHPYGYAEGSWSFRNSTACDTDVDDNLGVCGSVIGDKPLYLDMLLPEQTKDAVIIYYRYMSAPEVQFQYKMPLSLSHWQMGRKYIYELRFNPKGISLSPAVREWGEERYPARIR